MASSLRRLCAACAAALLPTGGLPARASCGSTGCFLTTGTREGLAAPGALRADFVFTWTDQDRRLEGTGETDHVLTPGIDFEEGEIEPDHHELLRNQETTLWLDLAWGATERLTVTGALPLRVVRDLELIHDPLGTNPEFTSDDGTEGFGDIQAGVRWAFLMKPTDLLVGGL